MAARGTNSRLEEMEQRFRSVSEALGEVTNQQRFNFQGAEYSRMYLKPTYKLGAALMTSRELLVLISPFWEVQARTISCLEERLKEFRGRLEQGIAIVVHGDPVGGTHLREWGRERGLTVLPLYAGTELLEDHQLFDALCSGLYSIDPFDLTGPVRVASQFFGRADVPDIARRLRHGHIQALFGMRKVGKTSVLNRILSEARDHHGMACAMLDCSDDSVAALDAGHLLHSIAGAIQEAISFSSDHYATVMPTTATEPITPSEAARTLLHVLSEAKRPVALLIDEVDYISPNSPTGPHWEHDFNPLFRALRQVYQECCRRETPFSIVVCGVSSHWFTVEQVSGTENAALALVPENYLPPLDRNESIAMIQTLGRSAGLIFDDAAAAELAATCSDMPFWIRRAGSYINSCFATADRPLQIARRDATKLCLEFVEVEGAQLAYSSLRHLFRIYPRLGDVALGSCRGTTPDKFPASLVSALGRYGLLGASFRPSGPMAEAGIERCASELVQGTQPALAGLSPAQPGESISAGSPSLAGEEEWAELLSEVSRMRNLLELQLRELVVAVIRLEASKPGSQRKPADLLLASINVERRAELAKASLQAIMKSLFWSDLINVVRKHWPAFAPVFGDKQKFELQADIVNDRPDAHAKSFDGAELALQRRACEWINVRIEGSSLL